MYSFRQAYEPLGTILDPRSPLATARDTLQNVTFIFLAINAGVSFTLIMAALCTVARYSKGIFAVNITYVALFLLTVIAGSILCLRLGYFKSHPLPGTPTPGQENIDRDNDLESQRRSMEQADHENTQRDSEFQDVALGDIGTHNHQTTDSYARTSYYPPYPQNPYDYAEEGHVAELSCDTIAQERPASHHSGASDAPVADLTGKYARFSHERRSRDSFEYSGNGQDTISTGPISQHTYDETHINPQHSSGSSNRLRNAVSVAEVEHEGRKLPFSPSIAQLSSWEAGDRRNYATLEEARADLRSNWRKQNSQ
ncbi:hypothetical protein F4805DRAFT_457480 [Annulohypoxylon moriforme]|nr:hypothetical protein F4805DRAFT_457480 [Annulohypoxylon moriforme]